MLTPTVDEFLVWTFEGRRGHYRLRVGWDDPSSDAPWYGPAGLRRDVIDRILRAVNAVAGMPPVRESLSNSGSLLLWFWPSGTATARQCAKRTLIRTVREVLATV